MDFAQPITWVVAVLGLFIAASGLRVVTSKNLIHAALFLVFALGGTAALFIILSAEFVAWVLVLVYIGAVVVLFLFGIMITRAPLGQDVSLSHPLPVRIGAAIVSFALFILVGGAMLAEFSDQALPDTEGATRTLDIGLAIFERFVIPFEVVSLVLLAALIGAIVLARRDPEPGAEGGGL